MVEIGSGSGSAVLGNWGERCVVKVVLPLLYLMVCLTQYWLYLRNLENFSTKKQQQSLRWSVQTYLGFPIGTMFSSNRIQSCAMKMTKGSKRASYRKVCSYKWEHLLCTSFVKEWNVFSFLSYLYMNWMRFSAGWFRKCLFHPALPGRIAWIASYDGDASPGEDSL